MAFTSHGHQIPGTVAEPRQPGVQTARCGGPNLCQSCRKDAMNYPEYAALFDTTSETGTVKDALGNPDVLLRSAKIAVIHAFNKNHELSDRLELTENDIYIVWFSKTLQNWKALLSTDLHDGLYYEVTYNGDKHSAYVDTYKKQSNTVVFQSDIARDL